MNDDFRPKNILLDNHFYDYLLILDSYFYNYYSLYVESHNWKVLHKNVHTKFAIILKL